MTLEGLISSYGYAAVAVGTFVEGETILVLGGFAAHRGYLELPWVMVAAFVGTLCGDQLYFYLGRTHGSALLDRRPLWRAKAQRAFHLLETHQTLFILGFRFLYGIRTVAPFAIGLSGVSPLRYLLLNAIGAASWAVVIGGLGYLFGQALEQVLDEVKRYEMWVLAGGAVLGGLVWMVSVLRERRRLR